MWKFRLLLIIILPGILYGTVVPVRAADTPAFTKENPETAQQMFSGFALLKYYSGSLDYIIQLDRTGSETNLEKMPFANVPQELEKVTGDFAGNGMEFTGSIVELFGLWNQQNVYIEQYRLVDAADLYKQITDRLPATRRLLEAIALSITATGDYLDINTASPQSDLKSTYDEVTAKIQQLSGMLDLLSYPMINNQILDELSNELNSNLTPEQLAEALKGANLNLTPEQLAGLLIPTSLTMEISPVTAYVGDSITFNGSLSSRGQPMADREITIVLNNTSLMVVRTDNDGNYNGQFSLPYRYVREATVQAIYYPQGDDAGIYLAATSPVISMTVLFYNVQLTLQLDGSAYPGREVKLTGIFDYADNPSLTERPTEIYFDNKLIANFMAEPVFNKGINIDSRITLGDHVIAISAPAVGRFASVFASRIVNVTWSNTIMELKAPGIGFIPGRIGLEGTLYSKFGPLEEASIEIIIDKVATKVIGEANGSFAAKKSVGMVVGLLGVQTITIQVEPQEPWNAPLSSTKNIFLINYVNIVIILLILALLGFYLPRRFKTWSAVLSRRKAGSPTTRIPVSAPAHREQVITDSKTEADKDKKEEISNPIVYWYRLALRLVQNITKIYAKPQQTLREYSRDVSRVLGSAGKYFVELTYLAERRMYGSKQQSESDTERSKRLVESLRKESKG